MVDVEFSCPCPPCAQGRADGTIEGGGCFETLRPEIEAEGRTFGHGPCVDPWSQGCTCSGTAVDGECEGCWLWLK